MYKQSLKSQTILVKEEIARYLKAEKSKNNITKPIKAPVLAEDHTPIYKMHRYFARRPYNVFAYIIKHYTKPGDIILDPFCGGGVTVVEGLKLRRKVIGVDINPLATYITKMEIISADIHKIRNAFLKLEKHIKNKLYELYYTNCPSCNNKHAVAKWFEWSNVVICSKCGKKVVLAKTKKKSSGRYYCPYCRNIINPLESKKLRNEITKIAFNCDCGKEAIKEPSEFDEKYFRKIEKNFKNILKTEKLDYPLDKFPDGDRQRDDALFQRDITHFYKLFTKRNLLANAILRKTIERMGFDKHTEGMLKFTFSCALSWTSILSSDTGHGWQHHAYWIPNISYEMNVWNMFNQRFKGGQSTVVKGKELSQQSIGDYCVMANNFNDLKTRSCLILTQSAHILPIPDNSVDIVITDPPFGGNVQYAELCDFWAVWMKKELGLKGIINNTDEAIQTRNSGFETAKSAEHYEEMLYKIFKECHRVLRRHGWMVMTFHNRDVGVWMSLQRAAFRAGFKLPDAQFDKARGMIYQPAIKHYTPTLHLRAPGSMLGDFILSYQRQETSPDIDKIRETLNPDEIKDLRNKIEDLIEFHGGTDENLLMTGLVPYLNEKGLLHRLANFDLRNFLNETFAYNSKDKKWYKKEMIDKTTQSLKPLDAIPAEILTETLITSYLREKKVASNEDLIVHIYTTLVNAHRPGIHAINKVIEKLCEPIPLNGKVKRLAYKLKSTSPATRKIKDVLYQTQTGIWGEHTIASKLSHNELILLLAKYAKKLGFSVHVGETEQRKHKELKEISSQMLSSMDYGIIPKAFDIVKEIDLLWLKNKQTIAAFEITTSINTADKAINVRYRNLFATMPGLTIKAFVIIKDKDYEKAEKKLFTPVNVSDGLCDNIKIIKTSQMTFETIQQRI